MKHNWTTWPFDRMRCRGCGIPWTEESYSVTEECSGVYKDYFEVKK